MNNFICIAVTGEHRRPTTYTFNQEAVHIGRSPENDIVFDPVKDGVVSRRHGVVRVREGKVTYEDLNSTQGSLREDEKIVGEIPVRSGDIITLGRDGPRVHFLFDSVEESSLQSPALIRSYSPVFFPLALYDQFPETFHEYQRIGEGGYGQVWIGRRKEGKVWTAIKFIRPELLAVGDDSTSHIRVAKVVERFKREFMIMKKLAQNREKGMIKIYKIGGEVKLGFVYMTMEYIEGESLDKLILRQKKIPEDQVCRYLYQLAVNMDYFHNFEWEDPETGNRMKGIVHRDVKPSNILIRTTNDRAYLCDFGIAAIEEGGGDRLTMPRMRVFTSKYSAPEVIRNNHITPASDLWGLAVVAYILFSGGFFPYAGNGLRETLEATERGELSPLKRFNPDLSSSLRNFIERALHPDPNKRPQNAREWVDVLAAYAPECTNSLMIPAVQESNPIMNTDSH
ncbi:MAG: FHA domain-containing serine/threonine-protein kinase [Candidatus Sumerlaeia bacterium]|nr:FHA domain-containing serine/threonine-protein kinase [Candidatus Sumerlaeia bacterium]